VSSAPWNRGRALFQAALEHAPEARAAFLSEACLGDETTRREVESLLAAHDAAGPFLETPACRLAEDISLAAPALKPGDCLGSFDVIGALGSGGMGEVYRALDVKLGREVAIKVLPRAFAADPQRLARFDRESRIVASLNHPHIAAIHSVERDGDVHFLVLELVEGPTLADRLRRGPLAADEALALALELASALEAAHDRGIVHRDVKPANIKVTSSSGVKLLDFGLAREHAGHDAARADPQAPEGTTDGLVLGTSAYMSPEQARGKPVDKRADIWAFGCVLFEMLAGTRAFRGDTPSDTIAAVLEREPDWSRLPAATAPGIRRLLRRCLEKSPQHRLHDVADARIEIEDVLANRDEAPARIRSHGRLATIAGLLTLFAGIVLGWWLHSVSGRDQPASATTRFTWALPDDMGLDSPPTVSPDGQLIAFTATSGADSPSTLYVRPLNQIEAQPVAGTEGAKQPFWSPDSRSVAYFARGKLMKVALDGGAPVEICAAPNGRGGAWSPAGVIVFSPVLIESGLMRVSANGGTVEPATLLDGQHGENSHRWPAFLPDGIHFLYFVRALGEDRRGVYLGRIDRPASTPGAPLFQSESEALYAPFDSGDGGFLLTVAGGRIEARPFDPHRRLLTGDPRTIDLPAAGNTLYHAMMLSISADVMTHAGASVPAGVGIASIGRRGENPALGEKRAPEQWPRLSADGRRLARMRIDVVTGRSDVWVEDLVRGPQVRVNHEPIALLPVWSPDGERLAYLAGSIFTGVLTIAAADGTGDVSTVKCPGQRCDPTDWSRDGQWLLATVHGERDQDVWLLPTDGNGSARPLLVQPFPEHDARFSPDGRLVAYVSGETGRPEVSVQTIDGPRRREVISVAGGNQPVWSRDGRELFFVDPQGLLRSAPVSMSPDGRPAFGTPVLLDVPPIGSGHWGTQYDVSGDGQRIYFLDRRLEPPPSEFGVVVGWRGMLK
jgi:eukaryotic-like serine/threonine-protein kinase